MIFPFIKYPSFKGKVRLGKYDKNITSSNYCQIVVIPRNESIKNFISKTNKTVYEFENNIVGNISLKF